VHAVAGADQGFLLLVHEARPADFGTVDVEPVCEVPLSKGWGV
jgi:hypothetical protein